MTTETMTTMTMMMVVVMTTTTTTMMMMMMMMTGDPVAADAHRRSDSVHDGCLHGGRDGGVRGAGSPLGH